MSGGGGYGRFTSGGKEGRATAGRYSQPACGISLHRISTWVGKQSCSGVFGVQYIRLIQQLEDHPVLCSLPL
jgi:hypothetical protein